MNENLRMYQILTDGKPKFFTALDIDCSSLNDNAAVKDIVTGATNQFLIFDRSGSMGGYMDDVIDSAMAYCNSLPDGSNVSVGYFSGVGEYNVSIPYVLKKELNGITKTLNTYRETCSLTNFIEVLEKVNQTVEKSKEKASLFFFTDGCHNSGGSFSKVIDVLKEWKEYAEISMFVGYGYIDRDNMMEMAKVTEGSFIHLDKFTDFKEVLHDFGISVDELSPTIEVDLSAFNTNKDLSVVAISGKNIVTYYPDENNKIKYRPGKTGYKGVFFLSESTNNQIITSNLSMPITDERGVRALAYSLSQRNNVPDASLLLNNLIEDKYLFRLLYNSISPDEFAKAEGKIKKSVFSTKERYKEGKAFYVVDRNAFCVLDAINVLMEEESVLLYPYDKDFTYERISKKTEQQDGSKISYDKTAGVKINDIVMNKERINISINTYSKGYVNIDPAYFKLNPYTKEDLVKLGLPEEVEVSAFKNYSIIADGRLKTNKLVLTGLSPTAIDALSEYITLRDDNKYVLDLEELPLVNNNYIKSQSAAELCGFTWTDKMYTDSLSVCNFLHKELTASISQAVPKSKQFTVEQEEFLKKHCYIKGDSYQPPVKTVKGEDVYSAYKFTIDIKGFSKVSTKDVIKKVREGKEPTQRESLVSFYYNLINKMLEPILETTDKLDLLNKLISDMKKAQKEIRTFLQASKFAVILLNKGKIEGIDGRGEQVVSKEVKGVNDTVLSLDFIFNIEKIDVTI